MRKLMKSELFFEKLNKIEKPLDEIFITKVRRQKLTVVQTRKLISLYQLQVRFCSYLRNNKRIFKKNKPYGNKFNNLDKIDKFFEKYNLTNSAFTSNFF